MPNLIPISILWLIFGLVRVSSADLDTCTKENNNYVTDFGIRCLQISVTCKNTTTLVTQSRMYCSTSNCNELKVFNSKLPTINSSLWPSYFCSVTSVTMNKCQIKTISKDAFSKFNTLKYLNLEGNNIQNLEFLDNLALKNLVKLILMDNELTYFNANSFKHLINLDYLDFDGNNLYEIKFENSKSFQKLTTLDLSRNNFSTIPSRTFFELIALRKLYLNSNKIVTLTSESFAGLSNLTFLAINNNKIEDIPLGTLNNLPLLKYLWLYNNNLYKFKIGTFSNLANLTNLDLSYNKFEMLDVYVFYPLQKLNSLDLKHNMLSDINYTSLLDHLSILQSITINDNHWSCKVLTKMLKSFKLRGVDYSSTNNRYNVENVEGIACNETEDSSENTNILNIDKEFAKLIQNSDRNNEKLTNVIKKVGSSINSNVVEEVQKLIDVINISSAKKNELLLDSNVELLDEIHKLLNLTKQKSIIENSIDNQHDNWPSYNYLLYLMVIVCIGIFCLLGVITYKQFHKSKFNKNQHRRSELELIHSN